MKTTVIVFVVVCICNIDVKALSFPGPRVYVVTPASRKLQQNEDKAPFYYHKWMDGWRRMDTASNDTTTTSTTPAPKIRTPDLIFAEFESDGSKQKSIRKLLENEKIKQTSSMSPIYVPDDDNDNKVTRVVNYGLPVKFNSENNPKEISTEKSTYSFMHDNDNYQNVPASFYIPSTTESTTSTTSVKNPVNIENIWHIIDNEKLNQYSGNWQEEPVEQKPSDNISSDNGVISDDSHDLNTNDNEYQKESNEEVNIDDNFALPGFATNPGSGAENESRAIRTEPNIRFPYVNLKPFQIKSSKKPLIPSAPSSKGTKNNNLLTNLDKFSDLKYPVRGEAQDIDPSNFPIDRYNPAQPYLPQPTYGSKVSKQSNPAIVSQKATANLVPPPPPLPPKVTGTDFPAPISYDSFPPYAPSGPEFNGARIPPMQSTSTSLIGPDTSSLDTSDSSDDDDGLTMDLGYRYKPPSMSHNSDNGPILNMGYQYNPPSPPEPQFIPTIPPPEPQSFAGYTYNKPTMNDNNMPMPVNDKPEVLGYHYSKPQLPKLELPPIYDVPPSYGHDNVPHYGDSPDDLGMMPPSPPTDMKDMDHGLPSSDLGFPADFPTDFKFHHDFEDDHDYHYHHPTTTTTTTEMPRVNRFSYYYLGKKLYYLPLYFSVYFIIYVGALIIKAVLRHKIVYPNSWRPNTTTASFFSKRSVDEFMANENLHEITSKVTHAIATAAEKYMSRKNKTE